MFSMDPKKHVRFSMLKLDLQDPGEEVEQRKKRLATRRLLIIAVVCVGTAVVLGVVALVVGLVIKEDTRKPISETEAKFQLPSSATTVTTPLLSTSVSASSTSSSLSSSTLSSSLSTSCLSLNVLSTDSNNQISVISPTPTIASDFSSVSHTSSLFSELSGLSTSEAKMYSSQISVPRSDTAFTIDSSSPKMESMSCSKMSSVAGVEDVSSTADVLASSVKEEMTSTILAVISTTPTSLPACKSTEYQCDGGECIPRSQVCDKVTNCRDQSDEHFCANCTGFQCQSGLCLWDGFRRRCDGVFHCSDLSDEKMCPFRPGYRYCLNGVQIPQSNWCDGVDHCYDNSDELSCPCVNGRYTCPDGSCILREWICDGHADCENATDEQGCSSCSSDEFVCSDYSCLNRSQVCDANYSCPGREDEANCFQLPGDAPTGSLRIVFKEESFPVCADHWTSAHSHFVCHELGLALQSYSLIASSDNSTHVMVLNDNQTFTPGVHPVLTHFHKQLSCLSERLVSVSCKQQDCGLKKASVFTPFIAGGSIVLEGKWPWVAALSYLGKYHCTGAVISHRWIVTAGHCVARPGRYNYSSTPSFFEIVLGATDRASNDSDNVQRLQASTVLHHPDMVVADSGVVDWDIALLQTATDINYTDYVQPLCLPDSNEVLSTTMLCYVAGWGWLNSQQYLTTEELRDAKMQLWSDDRCGKNTVVGETEVNSNSTLCAGYLMGLPTSCQGDSGGPLMCQKSPGGPWHLAGVVSSGSNECGQLSPVMRANRFARVASVVDWIQTVIDSH